MCVSSSKRVHKSMRFQCVYATAHGQFNKMNGHVHSLSSHIEAVGRTCGKVRAYGKINSCGEPL